MSGAPGLKWTDELAASVVADYKAGLSTRQLGAKYGVHRKTCCKYLHEAGVHMQRGRNRARNQKRLAAWAHLYRKGDSTQAIARASKVHTETVRRALIAYGVEMRGPGSRSAPVIDRIMAKVEHRGDCWHWTGKTAGNGYGRLMVNKKDHIVHRYVWEHFNGPLGTDRLESTCGDPACCNPAHRRVFTEDAWLRTLQEMTVEPDFHCWRIGSGGKKRTRLQARNDERFPNRIAWEEWRGVLTDADEVWRRCGDLHCINPDHLILVPKNTGRHNVVDLLHSDLRCENGHLMIGADARTVCHESGQPTRKCLACTRELTARLLAEAPEEDLNPRERFRRMRETEKQMAELLGVA